MGNRLEKPSLSERRSSDNSFSLPHNCLRCNDAFVSTGDILPAPGAEQMRGLPAPVGRQNCSKITGQIYQ